MWPVCYAVSSDNGWDREGIQYILVGLHGPEPIHAFKPGVEEENLISTGKPKASGPPDVSIYTSLFPNIYTLICPHSLVFLFVFVFLS